MTYSLFAITYITHAQEPHKHIMCLYKVSAAIFIRNISEVKIFGGHFKKTLLDFSSVNVQ
jgi:hypothetical protein